MSIDARTDEDSTAVRLADTRRMRAAIAAIWGVDVVRIGITIHADPGFTVKIEPIPFHRIAADEAQS